METYILKTKDFGSSIEQTYFLSKDKTFHCNHSSKEEIERSKLSRSCSRLKEIIKCNTFDYFITLTIKTDLRFDISSAIELLNSSFITYTRLAKNKGFSFKYVYVFELTKKGGVHLHGFVKGMYDLYENEYGHLSSIFFDNIGFQNFIEAKKVNENYLIKYIRKSPIYIKQVYHASRGLNKATVTYFHDYFNKFLDFPFTFKNQYCKMITYKK